MQYKKSLPLFAAIILLTTLIIITGCGHKSFTRKNKKEQKVAQFKRKIKHIVIVYEENWSFDGLFGDYPGCNNLSRAGYNVQVDRNGVPLDSVPHLPLMEDGKPDSNFAGQWLPPCPYDLLRYIGAPAVKTGDMIHSFYSEQNQIDGGKMDKFISWSDNGGLVMSYINLHNNQHLIDTLEWKLASDYTLCDNFFHSAFGGSFLNHVWLVAAAPAEWKDGPDRLVADPHSSNPDKGKILTPDKYIVNTCYTVNWPHPDKKHADTLVPLQTMLTIGDRMLQEKISWAWYAGGWDTALVRYDSNFEYHHQPFVYFKNFIRGSYNYKKCLRDETKFFTDLKSDSFPAVCFIKPYGPENEHPGYSDLWDGMLHLQKIVDSVKASDYWNETVIIVVSDENGGRWDHVAPPKIDRWGPGTRIPALIISPYAKKHYVDHTQYETVSILKLIETRFDLAPLTRRDGQANDLLNAFDF